MVLICSIINFFISLCSYLSAYYRNWRESDFVFQYEYEPRTKFIQRLLFLCKTNDNGIRKITKEQEIASIFQFVFFQLLIVICFEIDSVMFENAKLFFWIFFILIWISAIIQVIFFNCMAKQAAQIAICQKVSSESDLDKHIKKIQRHLRKIYSNTNVYSINKRITKDFFRENCFWELSIDNSLVAVIARSKKFRYSKIVVYELYDYNDGQIVTI